MYIRIKKLIIIIILLRYLEHQLVWTRLIFYLISIPLTVTQTQKHEAYTFNVIMLSSYCIANQYSNKIVIIYYSNLNKIYSVLSKQTTEPFNKTLN